MSDYRIDCSTKDGPDPDYRLDGFGGLNPNGTRWYLAIDDLIRWIDAGHTFWAMVNGRRTEVITAVHPRTQRRYVTTLADSYPPNNLLNLPNCR